MIQPSYNIDSQAVSGEQQILNSIKNAGTTKEQLKKVATEFEAVFVTKMLSTMDKTVDKEGGFFGGESKYLDNFKSYMFNEMGRDIASKPHSSIGFAKQIYEQMEKYCQG